MANTILHWVYHLYELEGIPPFPSHFLPIDFYISSWMSTSDTLLFRKEKHYVMQDLINPQSGLEYYMVRTGANKHQIHREYWEGSLYQEAVESLNVSPLSFDTWLNTIAERGKHFIESVKNAGTTLAFEEATDDIFGPVQVATLRDTIRGTDQFLSLPLEVKYKFDLENMRHIEQSEYVILEDNSRVLHRNYRLTKWSYLQPDEVSNQIFDPEYVVGLENALSN